MQDNPYPFDEVVDEKEAVRFDMDGDKWCANRLPFTNMMEMECGFGNTPMHALVDLIKQEAANEPPTHSLAGEAERAQEGICRTCGKKELPIPVTLCVDCLALAVSTPQWD